MIEKYIKSVLISAILAIALVTYRKIPSAYLKDPALVQYYQAIYQRYRQEAKHDIKSKPGGLPNSRGTCAINAFLQVVAAHYPTFFDEHKWNIQHKHRRLARLGSKIISKINLGQNVSREDATNFDRQLQKLKTIKTRGGIDPFYFIRDLFYYVNVANFKFVSGVEDFPTSLVTSKKQKKTYAIKTDIQIFPQIFRNNIICYILDENHKMALVFLQNFQREAKIEEKIKDLVAHMLVLTIPPPSTFHQDKVVDAELVACTHSPLPHHLVSYVKKEDVWFFTDERFIIVSNLEEVKEALAKNLINEAQTCLFYKFRYTDNNKKK